MAELYANVVKDWHISAVPRSQSRSPTGCPTARCRCPSAATTYCRAVLMRKPNGFLVELYSDDDVRMDLEAITADLAMYLLSPLLLIVT